MRDLSCMEGLKYQTAVFKNKERICKLEGQVYVMQDGHDNTVLVQDIYGK